MMHNFVDTKRYTNMPDNMRTPVYNNAVYNEAVAIFMSH